MHVEVPPRWAVFGSFRCFYFHPRGALCILLKCRVLLCPPSASRSCRGVKGWGYRAVLVMYLFFFVVPVKLVFLSWAQLWVFSVVLELQVTSHLCLFLSNFFNSVWRRDSDRAGMQMCSKGCGDCFVSVSFFPFMLQNRAVSEVCSLRCSVLLLRNVRLLFDFCWNL